MPRISKLKVLHIEKIFAIILFIAFVYLVRDTIIESFDRQVDLNVEKTIAKHGKESDSKFLEIFSKKSKDDFSNYVNLLIVIMLWFFIMFLNIQRKIKIEKVKLNKLTPAANSSL